MRTLMLAGALFVASPAMAQNPLLTQSDGLDAHDLFLAPQDGDPRDPLTVQRAGRFHQGEFWVTALFEMADEPLTLVYVMEDGRVIRAPALDNVTALNFSAGAAAHDRLRIDLAAPVYVASCTAPAPAAATPGVPYTGTPDCESQGGGIGDIRFTVTGALVRPAPNFGGGFGLAVMPFVDIPVGASEKFIGKGGLGFGGKVAATYEAGPLTVSLDAGPELGPAVETLNISSTSHLRVGGHIGVLLARSVGVNLEARYAMELGDNAEKGTNSPAEVFGTVRGRLPMGLHFVGGGGVGLTEGIGAARYRAFIGVGWGRVNMNYGDWDGDGIADEEDACIKEKETINAYQDADGCPDEGGLALLTVQLAGFVETDVPISITDGVNEWTAESGLEPVGLELPAGSYRAKAGYPGFVAEGQFVVAGGEIPVVLDLMEVAPGTLSVAVSHAQGGSLDKIGFSIVGEGAPPGAQTLNSSGLARMELPPGQYLVYLKTNDGALFRKYIRITENENTHIDALLRNPRVRVTDTRVEVDEKIYFDTGRATIKPESFDLLEEIATLLIEQERVKKIEIQGHTDDQGSEGTNLTLSQDRADAVREFLINVGVAQHRLDALGYGERYPVATNATEAGRATNRRVEFLILEQD